MERNKLVAVRVNEKMQKDLREIATFKDLRVSEFVRIAIREKMDRVRDEYAADLARRARLNKN